MTGANLPTPQPVIVIGAGSAGSLVAREVGATPRLALRVVAFVDDDPGKSGRMVAGIPVLGTVDELGAIAAKTGCRLAILAIPSAAGDAVRRISRRCSEVGLQLRTVPTLAEIISGALRASAIREVAAGDLLRRASAPLSRLAGEYLEGAVVLVTGAGGSIGSELSRQIARSAPRKLILFDVSESALYEIDREMLALKVSIDTVAILGNVRDRAKIERTLERHAPKVVFHAAACKHVPLAEANPDEAVLTNVFGTRNVIEASHASGVERLVHISTDKAAAPAGIMGASKRIAELLVQKSRAAGSGRFVAVRFGNVLGSSGSVVPLFKEQIAAGGPVTVGHEELERYFMTIPEAASLVIEAGALGSGGEVFVLDMGAPVLIRDLAEDMIRLSGFEPGRDIGIEFTGLRPGDAMRESLFRPDEIMTGTRNPLIRAATRVGDRWTPSDADLEALHDAALRGDSHEIRVRIDALLRADDSNLSNRPHSMVPSASVHRP